MAWEGFGMVGASAATPGGVGWVFIATPHKLAIIVQKLAVITYIDAALPRRGTTTKIGGTATALKNSRGHFTKNAITFYSELHLE